MPGFLHFPQIVAIFDDFQSSATYLALSTLKNYQILQIFLKKILKIFPMILITEMAAFETKNVHSVLAHYCIIINMRFIYSSFLSWKQNKVLVVSLAIQVNTLVLLYFKPSLILTSQLLPRVYLHFTFAIYYLRLNSL